MKSKMRPLWLVFKNEDPIGDDIYIMFKNGDGKFNAGYFHVFCDDQHFGFKKLKLVKIVSKSYGLSQKPLNQYLQ